MGIFGNTKELDSLDYRNFLSLTPEQQRQFGSAGLQFDDKGSVGNFSGLVSSLAGSRANESWGDKLSRLFTPNEKGTSIGGQFFDGIGKGTEAITGLAGIYYADKNFKLQKEAQDYAKSRDALGDAKVAQFQANYEAAANRNG